MGGRPLGVLEGGLIRPVPLPTWSRHVGPPQGANQGGRSQDRETGGLFPHSFPGRGSRAGSWGKTEMGMISPPLGSHSLCLAHVVASAGAGGRGWERRWGRKSGRSPQPVYASHPALRLSFGPVIFVFHPGDEEDKGPTPACPAGLCGWSLGRELVLNFAGAGGHSRWRAGCPHRPSRLLGAGGCLVGSLGPGLHPRPRLGSELQGC